MAVYVMHSSCRKNPEIRWTFVGKLLADTENELIAFALFLGLKKEWLHISNSGVPHFDLTRNKYNKALRNGAKDFDTIEHDRIKALIEARKNGERAYEND